MRGAAERGGGRGLVADLDIDAEIAGRLVPQPRRAGLQRVGGARHRRQRLVGDVDQLGGVLRLRDRLGDDHGDGLADKARLVGRHRVVGGRDRREAAQPHHHVGRAHQPGIVRDRAEPVGDVVGAGKDREHAGRRERRLLVDRDDARMGVRRAHDHRVRQARQR